MPGPVIRVDNVSFSWNTGRPPVLVIDHLEIAAGERIFVEGPSGGGKTTLLSLLGGVVVAAAGSVEVLGRDFAVLPVAARDRFRAEHIGIIFQMFNLIPYLSTVDNVLLPCHFSARRREKAAREQGDARAETVRLLARLGLGEEASERPVTGLSVGQQQRVAAARALIGAPDIVIADEPTSSLDTDARRAFIELLFEECDRAGATLVFVSHDRSLGSLFNRRVPLREINKAWKSPAPCRP